MKKVALITGATGGIGSAISSQLINDGFKVIATYIKPMYDHSVEWVKEKGFSDDQIRLLELDVTKVDECQATLTKLLEEEGSVDVLVNTAGITRDAQFKKMTADDWQAVINTNLNSVFNVTHPIFPSMLEKKSGRIVNITSVNGIKGQFGQTNYSAAKAGMIGFTKALALEGAKYGVTVNAVAPGYTATPMVAKMREDVLDAIKAEIPMKRLATPEDIANAVAYLVSDAGAYITGETLSVNGGLYMH
ncbi:MULTISPECIES: SDR family oxidoreductase [Vibrio]|uniref:Acetoacetyl-CoA reductase n=2 Tax=Vibrio TaxID=662 RepID=A0A7X4LJN9_9VIBR|nr:MULTISPECIES: SDR family oxidoreductase [Vibrio]MBF9003402.1 SDR family oxidoreductase [Vibrio nitrifigilis]MZI93167.1 acetoacetyl-CoA reductase [Vibrio eleionomae]